MASIFFVRCKRENRRFSGAKSRFSRAADRNKDAATRAGELIRGSLGKIKRLLFDDPVSKEHFIHDKPA